MNLDSNSNFYSTRLHRLPPVIPVQTGIYQPTIHLRELRSIIKSKI